MEKLNYLANILKKIPEISVLSINDDPPCISFSTTENIFSAVFSEIDVSSHFKIVKENNNYKIIFENESIIDEFSEKLVAIVESLYLPKNNLGIPDLSLVTIRQMAVELKKRSNITFAIVWIENSQKDNIAIEGSGNPTQLVGLLSRGVHMAIEWADKNIKFYRPKED
jgi:hypothetical protein